MEQPELGRAVGIIDGDAIAALRDEASHHLLPECLARNNDTLRMLTPEMEEMRLAATRWPMQRQGSSWPIRPPVYPAKRCGIAVRDQEIGAAQSNAAGQIEGELHHYSITRTGGVTRAGARPDLLTGLAPSARGCGPTAGDKSIPKRPWSRRPQSPALHRPGRRRRRGLVEPTRSPPSRPARPC